MAHVFDPDELHAIVKPTIGQPIGTIVAQLKERLAQRYPGHVRGDLPWVFNNAGGAMGSMLVLHASVTEYLIIFGTPIGTEGHTGRFWADDYFYILDGEQWAYQPGDLEREVYRPGEMHHLRRGTAQGYKIPDRCWALEYARGVIPLMLPFGVADSLTSTLDVPTLARTFAIYGRAAIGELRRGKL
jgi:C-8 sterol isomerase